jgi:hypothetical protein
VALTEDQRAMLQLLLERGQTYEDISSLLGSDVAEIRSRARGALQEMGGADPDGEVSLTDYLLGQADPIGRADAARHLQSDPQARDLAQKLVSQLRLIAPGADLPEIPSGAKASGSRFAPAAGRPSAQKAEPAADQKDSGTGLSGHQKRLMAGIGAGALVVLAIVLIAAGVFSGGDDNSSGSGSGSGDGSGQNVSNTTGTTGPQAGDPSIVSALLQPVGDADPKAKGGAVFGQLKGTPVLQVIAKGLTPTGDGENYSIWLYRADNAAFRLSGVRVGKSGGIAAQIPVPRQVIQFVSNGTFTDVDISLTKDSVLKAQAAKDRQSKKLTLKHLGESVLRGTIKGPGVGTAATGATGPSGG